MPRTTLPYPAIIAAMDSALPLVSYILVNWRPEEWLPRALRSIEAQDTGLREVILVNNASPDWDPALLDEFPQVRLLDLPRNLGFAGGNNAALRDCGGDFVVLLNCDAWLGPGFTRAVLDTFARHPQAGTIAPKVLRAAPELDGLWRIDSTGHLMRRDRTAFSRGAGELDQGQYDYPCAVFGASAAAVVYRRAMLDSIAVNGEVFDSSFFAYYEDVDLDWRAQLTGWFALYDPRCVAHHRGHGSGGRGNWHIRLRAEKNRYLMQLKNDSPLAQLRDSGPLLAYEIWHLLASLLRPIQLLGLLLGLRYIPAALARRFAAQPGWQRSPEEVAAGFIDRGPVPPLPPLRPEGDGHRAVPDAAARAGAVARPSVSAEQFPLVSVVLVNYNGIELTRAALRGLEQQSYPNIEIIVVDNGSRENEARELRRDFPQARVLRLERNGGFTAGCNWGVALAQGEWVVLLNNDAIPDPDCIRQLVYTQRATGASAVSGRLVDISDPALVGLALQALELEAEEREGELVVWDLPDELAAALIESQRNHGLSWLGYIVTDAYGARQECFYPSGGLCCIPRATLDALGPELFPTAWFAYYEDVALGFRIRGQGGWVAKAPKAAAVHLASSTARSLGSARLTYLRERNRLQTLLSFLPASALWRLAPLLLLQGLTAFFVRLLNNPLAALGQLASFTWCFTHIPSLLRQRVRYQQSVSRDGADFGASLSGAIRGQGGIFNQLSKQWIKLLGLPSLEQVRDKQSDSSV